MSTTQYEPAVIWLTGLSGSGKSTISDQLTTRLQALGLRVEPLDGDKVREIFPSTGFSRADRDAHIRRIGFVASRLEHHGVFVVASFVSPYAESREFVRTLCKNFFEVFVDTPLAVCEARDPKGLYARVRRGEIKQFTGVDDPYEAPPAPQLRIDTARVSVDEACQLIIDAALKPASTREVTA
ncbi:MAG: adenylyl-sulfate kinase [Gemmatimonadaceae bacterium]